MKNKTSSMILQLLLPTLVFIILGLVVLGDFVLQPNNTLFTFTIFGFSAVLFYYLIVEYNIRTFVLIGLLFTILMLAIFLQTPNILINIRNLNWFFLIGVLSYLISKIKKTNWYLDSKIWVSISWFLGFIVIYLIMLLLNIYVYQFYNVDERFTFSFYIQQALKIGGVLGVGLCWGFLLTQSIREYLIKAEGKAV